MNFDRILSHDQHIKYCFFVCIFKILAISIVLFEKLRLVYLVVKISTPTYNLQMHTRIYKYWNYKNFYNLCKCFEAESWEVFTQKYYGCLLKNVTRKIRTAGCVESRNDQFGRNEPRHLCICLVYIPQLAN